MDGDRFAALMVKVSHKYDMHYTLKDQQKSVIMSLLNKTKTNTMAFLPSGYGKSLTFTLLPLLLDEIIPDHAPHVALVISPRQSLMFDQVQRNNSKGIKSVAITKMEEMSKEDIEVVREGTASLIFASPEALECGPWVSMMQKYYRRVCLLAFDDIHCFSEWGEDFREDYLKLDFLRSKFTSAPVLGLSATVTSEVLEKIKSTLYLDDKRMKVISMLPDRPNIFLQVERQKRYDYEVDLEWIVNGLREQQLSYPKTIIYCSSVLATADMFIHIVATLGKDAYVGKAAFETRLVSMHHGESGEALQEYNLRTFPKEDSVIRVLVVAGAFGMGVEIPDIRQVVHWGKCASALCYWQEVSRAGRDGQPAKAIWYPKIISPKDQLFRALRQNQELCVRRTILKHFVLPGITQGLAALEAPENAQVAANMCCNHCNS